MSGSVPAVTAAQLPSVAPVFALVHASQAPLQAFVQQTPSAQEPPVHWVPAVHVPPTLRLAVQVRVPRSQNEPLVQFASIVHELGMQAVAFMQVTPPGQGDRVGVPGTHAPLPSQAAGVVVSWLPLHAEVPAHVVVAAATAHLRLPSHEPVVPQVVVPGAHSLSASLPAAIGLHTPFALPVFDPTQDSQVPAQSLSQQTRSTLEQTPLAQSTVPVQASPGFSLALPPMPP